MSETNGTPKPGPKIERNARLRWIPLNRIAVPPHAQREFQQHHADHILAKFDPEDVQPPTVNERGGKFYVIDGQHTIAVLREVYGEAHQVQCWVYVGLTEEDEAEKFLRRNDTLTVNSFDKFRISVNAGREIENDIERIVRAAGLVISKQNVEGGVSAVGTLRRIYVRGGAHTLGRTLRIIDSAFGTPGLESIMLDGIAMLCGRYNGALEDQVAVLKLKNVRGGVGGLLGKAAVIKERTRQPMNQCVAAAAVDVINAGKGGKKLPNWWRSEAA